MDKVLEFLQVRVFGRDRAGLLAAAVQGDDGVNVRTEELERLQRELDELNVRVRRQVANLESEELGSELAQEIRRAETLIGLRSKKQHEFDAARRRAAEHPTPENAQALLGTLLLIDLDWQMLQDRVPRPPGDAGVRGAFRAKGTCSKAHRGVDSRTGAYS